jgi:hypothetical protein
MGKPGARQKFIIDLERLNTLNAEGCAACGRKFTLGETVVAITGESSTRFVHEEEAVYDPKQGAYVERQALDAHRR